MVLNNVTKFHKNSDQKYMILRADFVGTYVGKVRMDGRTGETLNAPAIVMAGA